MITFALPFPPTSRGGPNEEDTCRDYVLPALHAAGWSSDQIIEQNPIGDGRIIQAGKRHKRARPLRADYVMEYRPGVPVAVVEAKGLYQKPGDGTQQDKRYARLLDLALAYSSNGKGTVEHDRHTGHEAFPAQNLLLHEMQQPNIVRGNALAKPITQIAKRERVDVVLTNPPFGGEEEKSIQANFPHPRRPGRRRRHREATAIPARTRPTT